MDREGPGRDVEVGRQSLYPEDFRSDAVALYRAADGKRTYAAVAADLGISGETLRTWVRKDTARSARSEHHSTAGGETETEELARLRAENTRLRGA
jgi:transposase